MNRNLTRILLILMMAIGLTTCRPPDGGDDDMLGYVRLMFDDNKRNHRDTYPDNEAESALTHLDVLIYEKVDYNFEPFYYERIDVTQYPNGTAYLNKKKEEFNDDVEYKIYVIANSTHNESTFTPEGKIITHNKLLQLDQTDENIHLSGIRGGDNIYPQYFLMDGVAYMGNNEPDYPGTIIVNDSGNTDDVVLKVKLRRATAKYIVKIFPGENVRFNKELLAKSKGYMMRNMPVRTRVAAEGNYPNNNPAYWMSSTISQSPYFEYIQEDEDNYHLRVIVYCYSHKWKSEEFFEKGTSFVFMLPVIFTEDGNETEYINNYYQLVLNKKENVGGDYDHIIKRNTLYELHVNVNAPGAEDYTEAEVLEDIKYFTAPWTEVGIDVEGDEMVKYLKVNKNNLSMHNITEDNTTIFYSSSSPVTTSIVNGSAYYYNKYGNKTIVDPDDYNISASASPTSTSGNLTICSDIPQNNTTLYFTVRVTNEEGLSEDILVEQYSLVYVTNSLPWYSYRDDYYYRQGEGHTFTNCNSDRDGTNLPTTYSYAGDIISSVAVGSVDKTTHTVTYTYNRDAGSSRGFFTSKYRGNNDGNNKYENNFYYWGSKYWWGGEITLKSSLCENNSNLRNYHIRIMATSDEYILARPRIDENGHTDSSPENAKLVSPSFVIASRLGAVYSTSGGLDDLSEEELLIVFADHAKHYVEVDDIDDAKDPNRVIVYDDWRLPTRAEIEIIIKLQGEEGQDADAIDYLLNGRYYMSADGPVENPKYDQGNSGSNSIAVRCVRDVF